MSPCQEYPIKIGADYQSDCFASEIYYIVGDGSETASLGLHQFSIKCWCKPRLVFQGHRPYGVSVQVWAHKSAEPDAIAMVIADLLWGEAE